MADDTRYNEARREESLVYITDMLVELRQIAHNQRNNMLAYLIDMAIIETNDLRKAAADRI